MVINNIHKAESFLKRSNNLPLFLHTKLPDNVLILVATNRDVKTLLNLRLGKTISIMTLNWSEEYKPHLKDSNVMILHDNDKPGLLRQALLCEQLYGLVKSLRVIDLPGVEYRNKRGQGITHWIKMGHTREDLLKLIKKTPEYEPFINKESQS